jgi:hypothetical protein
MSSYLCTFSGKYGDILWSLATAKFIAERIVGEPVDFAVMPYYENLCPLIQEQSYVDQSFVIKDWLRTNSNYGDQPWQPPPVERSCEEERDGIKISYTARYSKEWHLTYRGHPGISAPTMPLMRFIAYQQGIDPDQIKVPFLDVTEDITKLDIPLQWYRFESGSMEEVVKQKRLVTFAFNEQYADQKKVFLEKLWMLGKTVGLEFLDLNSGSWRAAAWAIKHALVHVGCRSAAWVVATGLGQETITFEPHPSRHKNGHLGQVFTCPLGLEQTTPYGMPAEQAAGVAHYWIVEKMKRTAAVGA